MENLLLFLFMAIVFAVVIKNYKLDNPRPQENDGDTFMKGIDD